MKAAVTRCPEFLLTIVPILIVFICGISKAVRYDFEQRTLRTLGSSQSENEHLSCHLAVEYIDLPRDVWVIVTGFIDLQSRNACKCTNRILASITNHIEITEISVIFEELFENTHLTPSDIATHVRPYYGPIDSPSDRSRSPLSCFMDRHKFVMVQGRCPLNPKNGYLAVKVRDMSDATSTEEVIKYLIFHFREGLFYGLGYERHFDDYHNTVNWVARREVREPESILVSIEVLIAGKWLRNNDYPATLIVRSDIRDAEWCFRRYIRPHPRCIICQFIIVFYVTLLIWVLRLMTPQWTFW